MPPSRRNFLGIAAKTAGILAFAPLLSFARAEATVTIIDFTAEGKRIGKVSRPKVTKTDAEWQRQLSPISFTVTRQSGTERPYSGSTWDLHERGLFRCVCCDNALFS
jgi:peptide-methionine (R)-S-oxide reductase